VSKVIFCIILSISFSALGSGTYFHPVHKNRSSFCKINPDNSVCNKKSKFYQKEKIKSEAKDKESPSKSQKKNLNSSKGLDSE
jgi:hypothetical protein